MTKNSADHFQVPLMFAFRDAFEKGDAKERIDVRAGGERVMSARGSLKRRGADEALLRRNLAIDLLSLVNTIDLGSAIELDGFEHVGRSILNFGLYDVNHLVSDEAGVNDIGRNLTAALLQYEPRLYEDSLRVERQAVEFDDVNHRIRFSVSAEMACRPFDIPVEFVAEVDVGSGKLHLTRLPTAA